MPQNTSQVFPAVFAGVPKPQQLDAAAGNLKVATQLPAGVSVTFNIAAAAIVKAGASRLLKVCVVTPGSAAGSVNDCATTGAAAIGNQIASLPNTAGAVLNLDWPCAAGIVITPGSGQVLSCLYV